MAYCHKCGCYIDEEATVCPACGAKTRKNGFSDSLNSFLNTENHKEEFTEEEINSSKVVSALAYFGITFWVPLVVEPQTAYGKFHANQGLLTLIVGAVLAIVSAVFGDLWLIGRLISAAVALIDLFNIFFGLINTLNGNAKELPLIGKITLLK